MQSIQISKEIMTREGSIVKGLNTRQVGWCATGLGAAIGIYLLLVPTPLGADVSCVPAALCGTPFFLAAFVKHNNMDLWGYLAVRKRYNASPKNRTYACENPKYRLLADTKPKGGKHGKIKRH